MWFLFLIFCCITLSGALEVTNGKTQVRETKDRAQLSLVLQVTEKGVIPANSSYEKELLYLIRDSLQEALSKRHSLRHHQRFTHIFVTALANSADEEVLAVLSKTPQDSFPIINIFRNNSEQEQEKSFANLRKPPAENMFEQLRRQRIQQN